MNRKTWDALYKESIENKEVFFERMAKKMLNWDKMFTKVYSGNFEKGINRWFEDGYLNACYNCVDRHDPKKLAILYSNEDGCVLKYTYGDLLKYVCCISNYLKDYVKVGDCVGIYMPTCPVAAFSMLSCARLGVTHNVVFGGFSAESLRMRMIDSKAKILITVKETVRGGKKIDFLKIVKEAVNGTDIKVLVMDEIMMTNPEIKESEDESNIIYFNYLPKNYSYVPCVSVNSENRLFYLYTSGSTGQPKGIYHSTAGYILYAMLTIKYCFDLKPNDVFFCTADFGWITGHSYTLYGPLLNGVTTVLLGGAPLMTTTRIFELVNSLNATQFYTAPTLIRMLMKATQNQKVDFKFPNLRYLGSVGEPLNKDAYDWYVKNFGNDRLPVIDTYWQTEAGGFMLSPIPGVVTGIPECACIPFLGMKPLIVNESGLETKGLGKLVFSGAWPGIARGIINDEKRFFENYFNKIKGYYFTGDEGYVENGLFWVQGRADDVINVSAHRISTAEVESAVCSSGLALESAVVAVPDEITGQAIVLFVVPNESEKINQENIGEKIRLHLRKVIGPVIQIKKTFIVKELPKTSTGKLMRRVLRCVLNGEEVGDLSTCMNSASVEDIRLLVGQ